MKLNKAMERHIIYCRETRRMSPNTVKSYEYAVRRFVEFMGFRYTVDEVEHVCKNHILDYLRISAHHTRRRRRHSILR